MAINRRSFLLQAVGMLTIPALGDHSRTASELRNWFPPDDKLPLWRYPDLHQAITHPVVIQAVELHRVQGRFLLTVTAKDGVRGITQCNDRMEHLTSLLKGLVIPHFKGHDARDVQRLVDNAYRLNSNYKYTGMPLWNCIGSVEIAVWDLLGKAAKKPAYALLGTAVRNSYDVYISDWSREGDPERIADQLLAKLDATGAKGVKIKVGGRMVNTAADTAQTRRFVPLLRKRLGDSISIYADANGSYTPAEGIDTGRMLEDHGVEIFEEPCNFEDEDGTRSVNEALTKLTLAGGEQDTSPYRFRKLAQRSAYDVLQPDVYYNGGILKTLQVSEIARQYGSKGIAPHTPKADPLIAPFWQVAALVPNLYGLQEFVFNIDEAPPRWHSPVKAINGSVSIPSIAGLGIEYDESIWKSAERIVG